MMILPMSVVAVKSPKPILVTAVKQNYKESPYDWIPGSTSKLKNSVNNTNPIKEVIFFMRLWTLKFI